MHLLLLTTSYRVFISMSMLDKYMATFIPTMLIKNKEITTIYTLFLKLCRVQGCSLSWTFTLLK